MDIVQLTDLILGSSGSVLFSGELIVSISAVVVEEMSGGAPIITWNCSFDLTAVPVLVHCLDHLQNLLVL